MDSKHPPFPTDALRGTLRYREPLARHTTWRVGGVGEWFYQPADIADLAHLMQCIPPTLPLFWLGLGSNLLIREGGIRGVIIAIAGRLNTLIQIDNDKLYAEAGVNCAKIARFASKAKLGGGAEFLAGIPGTFGGALAMNAGAFGGETWSLVEKVELLNRQGTRSERIPSDYEIGYRHVQIPPNEWFIGATLRLNPDFDANHQIKIHELLEKRQQTQPIGLPSAGSVFRNPTGDYAGRLIEQAGWKGYRLGGAQVSEKHANFIINTGNATATDIEQLINQIKQSVAEKTGIELIPEVRIVGEFAES